MTQLWRSTIHGSYNGVTVDVIHGWLTDDLSVSQRNDFASRIEDVWAAQVMPGLSNGYGITEVRIVGMEDPTLFGAASSEAFGGVASTRLPAFVVANVQLVTGLRGRSYQGRYGIPGLTEDMTEDGNGNQLIDGVRGNLQGYADAYLFGVESGTITAVMKVISTISGGTPRPVPIGTSVVNQIVHKALGSRVSRKG